MKLAWLTDIHLNFLDQEKRELFYKEIVKCNCDAILISGDIAEAPSLIELLNEMAAQTDKIIYFVLGNHDYYKGQIDEMREAITALSKTHQLLRWIPACKTQLLENNTALVGHDGWADGRLGDYYNSKVSLNDSRMIADLFQQRVLSMDHLLQKMQQLADDDAEQLKIQIDAAVNMRAKKIIVVTHVPPFKEASIYKGKISDDGYLPFFTSKATGDVLMQAATENPEIKFLVLCGHTHGAANYSPLHNLTVKAGAAEYYKPAVQQVISTEQDF